MGPTKPFLLTITHQALQNTVEENNQQFCSTLAVRSLTKIFVSVLINGKGNHRSRLHTFTQKLLVVWSKEKDEGY